MNPTATRPSAAQCTDAGDPGRGEIKDFLVAHRWSAANKTDLTGRITRLIYDQQFGTIAGEDGADYPFS